MHSFTTGIFLPATGNDPFNLSYNVFFFFFYFASVAFLVVFALSVGLSCAEPQCQQLSRRYRRISELCGYNYTTRFNFSNHFYEALGGTQYLHSVYKDCSAFSDVMVCSIYIPRCTQEINGPYLPCRGVCYQFANECNDVMPKIRNEGIASFCDLLPEKDNPQTTKGYRERCFTPPNYRNNGMSK